ncbi:MAG: DUF2793 domain-containing protein [Pseudomonadota bacterium]
MPMYYEATNGADFKSRAQAQLAPIFADQAAVSAWDAGTVQAIIVGARLFARDDSDTLSIADGIVVHVSNDNVRFKADVDLQNVRILRSDVTVQPTTGLSLGDAYLLIGAPSGTDWASKQDSLAIWTGLGGGSWVFLSPWAGLFLAVEEPDMVWRYAPSGQWQQVPAMSGALRVTGIQFNGLIPVENETTTTPPTATDGVAYVVPADASSPWDTKAGQVAIGNGTGWDYSAPYEGFTVWNKALGRQRAYQSGGWADTSAVSPYTSRSYRTSGLTGSPPAATGAIVDEFTHTLLSADSGVRIHIQGNQNEGQVAVFRDGLTTPVSNLWSEGGAEVMRSSLTVEDRPGDTLPHTYRVRALGGTFTRVAIEIMDVT